LSPAGLTLIQDVDIQKVFKILVIGENTDWVSGIFMIMSPFVDPRYYVKHIVVMDFVVDLDFIHLLRVKAIWCNRLSMTWERTVPIAKSLVSVSITTGQTGSKCNNMHQQSTFIVYRTEINVMDLLSNSTFGLFSWIDLSV
jgi:hypothetical protein